MQKQTAEILMLCKGEHFFNQELTFEELVRTYLVDRYKMSAAIYTPKKIEAIVIEALFDFIDTADTPSEILRDIKELNDYYERVYRAKMTLQTRIICEAFTRIDIKNKAGYINGFTEETAQKVKRIHPPVYTH